MMNNIHTLINKGVIKIDNDVIIGTTRDYDLFNLLSCNRKISTTNVNNIKRSILRDGYCKCNEVIVDDMWNVVDGQHTFTACKELGMDIRFKMIKGVDVNTIITLNTHQKNWVGIDFVKSYAARGYEDYKLLLDVIEANQDIGFSAVMNLMFDNRSAVINMVQDGTIEVTDAMIEKCNSRIKNYRILFMDYKDRMLKGNVDHICKVMPLLDNDFMVRMLTNIFSSEPEFNINLGIKDINHMELIADKIHEFYR